MKNKILVVVAHPDDEVLGVGGTILKHISRGDAVSILIMGDGELSRESGADVKKRENQARAIADLLGVENLFLEKFPDNQSDTIPLLSLTKKVGEIIEKIQPATIYTHHAHDLNIDHRLTCQAVLTACRPQPSFCVKQILSFEVLSSTEWQLKEEGHVFLPTYYQDITEFIDKKIEILKVYSGELKDYPHPRSVDGVRILAQYRGMEVGFAYAEAFQAVRLLID